jgi:hypothetical protein
MHDETYQPASTAARDDLRVVWASVPDRSAKIEQGLASFFESTRMRGKHHRDERLGLTQSSESDESSTNPSTASC